MPDRSFRQVAGVDDLFNEKMRVVVEYMQYRELSSDIKRKVGWGCAHISPAVPLQLGSKGEIQVFRINVVRQRQIFPHISDTVAAQYSLPAERKR